MSHGKGSPVTQNVTQNRPRGRPRTGTAMTAAERKRKQRLKEFRAKMVGPEPLTDREREYGERWVTAYRAAERANAVLREKNEKVQELKAAKKRLEFDVIDLTDQLHTQRDELIRLSDALAEVRAKARRLGIDLDADTRT
jgi:hypothetical protein